MSDCHSRLRPYQADSDVQAVFAYGTLRRELSAFHAAERGSGVQNEMRPGGDHSEKGDAWGVITSTGAAQRNWCNWVNTFTNIHQH